MKFSSLSGKVVVITGASSGFGRGVALQIASQESDLALAARRSDLLEELALACERAGGRALAVPSDVSIATDVERLCRAALEKFGRIDIWINNAGVGAIGRFERIPLEDHTQVVATNLLGVIYGCYFAYKQFLKQRYGTIINVASELGFHSVPYYSSYAASKHGVMGLSDSLRAEIRESKMKDIHLCVVMPTAHDTPFFDHVANYTGHEVNPPAPLHEPENVVETIVRLAHDPEDSEIVGKDGIAKIIMKRVAPGLLDRVSQKQTHKQQMVDPPPAPDSPGAVRLPIPKGRDLSAGRLEGR